MKREGKGSGIVDSPKQEMRHRRPVIPGHAGCHLWLLWSWVTRWLGCPPLPPPVDLPDGGRQAVTVEWIRRPLRGTRFLDQDLRG